VTTFVIAVLAGWLVASSAVLALVYRRALFAAWSEPVLRAPVLIFESDDWGYGPLQQAQALDRMADVLAHFRDTAGRHPVATLGVVLAGPDTQRMREEQHRVYHRVRLDDARLAPVREAMLRGAARGVFALQLHGLEHFRPQSLMRRIADASVRERLSDDWPRTEELPSTLQSRWIDASVLPSAALAESEVLTATAEEAQTFAEIFGAAPTVAVPTTFVWTDAVERGWARAGVRVVVTPGVRNESRNAKGEVVETTARFFNGERGPEGAIYVVRDAYFEPALGHTSEDAMTALRAKALAARPALLEMHRFNFLGETRQEQHALDELTGLLKAALSAFPGLRFMSTAELAQQYREQSALVEGRVGARFHFFIRRLAGVSRLRKLAWATGAALPAWLAYVLTRPGEPVAGGSAA
jgi:hypothetical protein